MEEEMGYSWSALLVWLRAEGFTTEEVHQVMMKFGCRKISLVQLELPLREPIPEDIY